MLEVERFVGVVKMALLLLTLTLVLTMMIIKEVEKEYARRVALIPWIIFSLVSLSRLA
jgi:hypothetical protein